MSNTQQRGQRSERQAEQYLVKQGLTLVERNYHCRHGEIDLIMRHKQTLVFIEVRYRKSAQFGGAAVSVDKRKQQRIIATAENYLQQKNPAALAYRFDVVAMSAESTQWIVDAFRLP